MERTTRNSLLFLFFVFCIGASAQQQDFQSRIGLDVSGDVASDFEWSAKVQQRWRYNSSLNDRTLLQGGFTYSPLGYLKLGVGYRGSFIHLQDKPSVYKQRMHFDLVLSERFDRFKFAYRSRLQYGFDDFQTFSFVGGQALTWRNRIGVKYYPFGWSLRPQASVELFNKLNSTDERSLSGVRYIIGSEYLLNQHMSVSLNYMLNKELNDSNPMTENILSASFSYRF